MKTTRMRRRRMIPVLATLALPAGLTAGLTAVGGAPPVLAATTPHFTWTTVANNADKIPGSTNTFNSYTQPSVNADGLVVFRGHSKGPEPVRGVYKRNPSQASSPITRVVDGSMTVPQPNNLDATFNEFPSFARIAKGSSVIATRAQSTPVWKYLLPDGTETRTGTTGIYATPGGVLTTAESGLGAVPGQSVYSVPGAPAGTKFDQFPGAPAVDGANGKTIIFKGNYTEGATSATGVYFRDLSRATNPTRLIANTHTLIPNQPSGGTATFGSTAPPSAAGGRMVFVGLDNENSPTMGGIYLAPLASSPKLRTLVGIGSPVPGSTTGETFTGFSEGLSFDGRFVAYEANWGSATRSITLKCPTDGNKDLIAYCLKTYGEAGYTTSVPVNQGVFVYDTTTNHNYRVAATGSVYTNFWYWVFSGRPPGTGGGDEPSLEPPRWRHSSFVAVSGLSQGKYRYAFKADATTGVTGLYLNHGPWKATTVTMMDTTTAGTAVDREAPAGSLVTSIGLERDGFRGRYLAVNVGMLDAATSTSFAGIYRTIVY